MRLDKKFVVVVAVSLGWALLVSAAFYRMAKSGARSHPASPEKQVVVAAQALEMGAVIKAESVRLIRMPEPLVPKGSFSKPEDVLDRPVISSIQPDEPILEARLALRGSGCGRACARSRCV
jgi:pilus assembly protein CpaB